MDGQAKTTKPPRERRSQSAHAPSVQVYWRDWLGDPDVLALSFDLRGRYHHWWLTTHGTATPGIVSEDALRRTMGLTPRQWEKHRAAIAACFRIRRDGMWIQERTVRERAAQKKRHQAAKTSGRKGGRKRWADKGLGRGAMTTPAGREGTRIAEACPSPLPKPLPGDRRSPSIPKTQSQPRSSELSLASDRVEPDVGRLVGRLAEKLAIPERGS